MSNISEKRKRVHAWLDSADEAEIDALLETISPPEKETYEAELLEELDRRRASYLSGESKVYTLEEMNTKLDMLLKKDG
jgi:hypothetical protein